MRIECPACAAAYEVPEELIGAGQTVGCARCGAEWTPRPGPEPTLQPQIVQAPLQPEVPPAEATAGADWFDSVDQDWSPPVERSPLVPMAWIGSVVVLVALLAIGVATRDSLMAQWPPSSRLFAALGLDDR